MSTEYEFFCRECNAALSIYPGSTDTSHYHVPMMQAVVAARHVFAAIPDDTLELFRGGPLWSVVPWMKLHHTHEVVVRDEYGRDADNPCRKHEHCVHCGESIRCALPDGHPPPCRRLP